MKNPDPCEVTLCSDGRGRSAGALALALACASSVTLLFTPIPAGVTDWTTSAKPAGPSEGAAWALGDAPEPPCRKSGSADSAASIATATVQQIATTASSRPARWACRAAESSVIDRARNVLSDTFGTRRAHRCCGAPADFIGNAV